MHSLSSVRCKRILWFLSRGRMTGKPHLTLVSVGCCSRARCFLTAARKLQYSWILRRLSGLITQGDSVSLLGEQYLSPFRCRSHHQLTPPSGSPFTIPVAANPAG